MEDPNNKNKQVMENGQVNSAPTETQPSSPANIPTTAATTPTNNALQQSNAQMAKQIKILQMKNKKLQAKYIQLFKQQKLLKKDWGVFVNIVKIIFPHLEEKPLGKYDLDQLKQKWVEKQKLQEIKIKQMTQDLEKQKYKMQQELSQLAQQKINNATRQCKQKVQTTTKQLQTFRKNNKYLAQQLTDLDKKLDGKNDQLSKLTKQKLKLEHHINQLKMKSITDELVEQKRIIQQRNKMERNQLLALRHQIGNVMQKRDQYRDQLKASKQEIAKLKELLLQKDKLHENNVQNGEQKQKEQKNKQQPNKNQKKGVQSKISISSSQSSPKKKQSKQSKDSRQQQNNMHHLVGDDQYVHRQYMKNVFIRYMKSWAKGDPTQTEILLNIILTMLKFTGRQRQMIVEKKKAWWGLY